jgi:antitoxin Phd
MEAPMQWQVQEAKQRFSELVRRALSEGPQQVTRHGDEVVVVLAADEFYRLIGESRGLKDLLLGPPFVEIPEVPRDSSPTRRVDFLTENS